MAPAITIDNLPDLDLPQSSSQFAPAHLEAFSRTLLLSPPSLSSHPDKISAVVEAHDRDAADLQMLDRIIAGVVPLPENTYGAVLIITNADGEAKESARLLEANPDAFLTIAKSMKPGAFIRSQDGTFGRGTELLEGTMAGLMIEEGGGMSKPIWAKNEVVSLKRKEKKYYYGPPGKPNDRPILLDEDGRFDEESLMEDYVKNYKPKVPKECEPKAKRRRACKDCTCGLAQELAEENKARKEELDDSMTTMKLNSGDLAEVDFTIKGKTGSCGSCALGDAFRCSGCPYTGLPPFKAGEEVKILDNEVQL